MRLVLVCLDMFGHASHLCLRLLSVLSFELFCLSMSFLLLSDSDFPVSLVSLVSLLS